MMVIDLDAPLVPGRSAAGFRIGQVLDVGEAETVATLDEHVVRVDCGAVSLWLKDAQVDQVGVRLGYFGTLSNGIGVGSTVGQVVDLCGGVTEDEEDNLSGADESGWCFETEEWSVPHDRSDLSDGLAKNRDAKIVWIFIFGKEAI